ncbi:MAG TPA: hypothetical protein DHV22_07965 [Xanthomarina gelatinilytica]|uniref:Uncharacterized protein n=1 Tax=Xanthomarina gelatinilytica TaxID=1137281 RepID=A0A3D6BQR9_9FLAO|nr:hypothetical protein [Xanthomarina gelatinilytica]
MAVREQTIRLHQAIKEDFDKLSSVKEYGVPKYTNQYILNRLAEKYFKSARTIENIVFGRVPDKYKDQEPTQISMNL